MCHFSIPKNHLGKKLKHNETYIDEIDVKTCCSVSTCCILLCFLAGATFGWQCVCDGVWDGNQWTFLTFCTSFNGPFGKQCCLGSFGSARVRMGLSDGLTRSGKLRLVHPPSSIARARRGQTRDDASAIASQSLIQFWKQRGLLRTKEFPWPHTWVYKMTTAGMDLRYLQLLRCDSDSGRFL